MNKKLLIVFTLFFCVFVKLINPISVNALEEEVIDVSNSSGEKIEYTVREENISEGYVGAIEDDGEIGFIIHNYLGQGGDVPPHDNPQTGDNIVLYLITLIVNGIGLVTIYEKENI